ncbi:DUF4112 domain-containing protein [Haloterrigena sp. SYSU A558-1]|uniref:DUF4112 domain-containing protein n=1 Tax=Haloterrigena gelatinilytica TaxID=2741724 RepID=A0A8J8GR70_9EURY|nr:DUF4112 domain-containing protein [Haloterrigena gelatinilytica]NUB92492.1 DUF4112 domain-containing protein [Haloterrigena gelatinilytica]NUC71591.1 DUF4112 domain-containing protein [Haloterrigena gelatinilytica]
MATGSTDDIEAALEEFGDDLPAEVDEAAISRMRTVARALDEGFRLPGTNFRFGLDPIVGILPGAGDTATALVSLYIVAESARMGVSQSTLLRMLANIAVDTIGGSVPILGVLFDAFWKSNKWNVKLAIEELADSSEGSASGPETVVID